MASKNQTNLVYQKPTILQVVPSLIAGGVERGTIDLTKHLINNGYRAIVISSGGPLVQNIIECGAEHIQLKVSSKNPFRIWRNISAIAKIIEDNDVKIVHARSRAPAWSSYYAAKRTNVKFITTFHGIYNFSTKLKKIYNSIMISGERIIAVSDFVKQHLVECYNADPSIIRVIHRGVDPEYFNKAHLTETSRKKFIDKYHVPNNTPVILLPARMTNWKGHMVLLEAISKIKDLSFYCIIAGDLSKHPAFACRVNQKIIELKLQSKVQVFGPESDMMNLYGISDIVLSTSIEPEAFGRVVVEAQSMEKLVISTNIGGACETITDAVNGFHIIPNNPEDLANKLRHALSILGTEEAEKICHNSRISSANNFSLQSMLSKTIDVYNELL
jgi:glycosyltransferase involved in cell wall biosynthesis